ncbi:unnamed protein product [Lymnaea stagnalis]|uniref:Elongation of very long chain fatty acids protein n=1 Tax=Lymnaea stagnalis TaxID=6523 RepID=A0AAV2HBG0_LYMST
MATFNSTRLVDVISQTYALAMSKDDKRVRDWPLIQSPLPAVATVLGYVVLVVIGPRLMSGRDPVQLGHVLSVYNLTLVALSAYMAYEFCMSAYLAGYSLGCQMVDFSTNPLALRMARVCWLYYISKYTETADTIFFILRKKTNQLTFLHVYHHSTMIFIWWINAKYVPGGLVFFHATLNCFVHVIMYSYYGLAALGPSLQPYLWWKKYVTKVQLIQFFATFIHTLYVCTRCDFPLGLSIAALLYDVTLILLFINYYHQEYVTRKRSHLKVEGYPPLINGTQNGDKKLFIKETQNGDKKSHIE